MRWILLYGLKIINNTHLGRMGLEKEEMMYNNKLVAVIKVNNKVLRENNGTVFMPFGSEYSIMLNNLNTRKAKISITIDGDDVLDGNSLILDPKEKTELNGFMSGSTVKNRFRFIEKTEQISNYRGDKILDGIIDITYSFEKSVCPSTILLKKLTEYDNGCSDKHNWLEPLYYSTPGGNTYCDVANKKLCDYEYDTQPLMFASTSYNDNGITVKGSRIHEDYDSVCDIMTGQEYNIVFLLKGTNDNNIVRRPITVKTKIICETCGKNNKSCNRYCSNCGTYLCGY